MIADALIGVAQSIIAGIASLLPAGVPLGLVLPTGWLYGYDVLNSFLPVSELLLASGVLLGLRLLIFGLKTGLLVVNIVWHSGA